MWQVSGVAFSKRTVVSFPPAAVGEDEVNGNNTFATSSQGGTGRLRTGIIGMLILLLFDAFVWCGVTLTPPRMLLLNEFKFEVGEGGGGSGKRW